MSDFLREIDIGIGMSQCDHLVRVYRTFGEHMEGRKIAFKRLLMLAPLVKEGTNITPLLDMAENLPLRALQDEIREAKGLVASDQCLHPVGTLEAHYRCTVCGAWVNGRK
jgi:hypothetical protein